jgi:hypothetical protein
MWEASVLDVLLELGQRLSLISGAVFVVRSLLFFVHFIFICDKQQQKDISYKSAPTPWWLHHPLNTGDQPAYRPASSPSPSLGGSWRLALRQRNI